MAHSRFSPSRADHWGNCPAAAPLVADTTAVRMGNELHRFLEEQWVLDAREEECWAMFGVQVEHIMDERIINSDVITQLFWAEHHARSYDMDEHNRRWFVKEAERMRAIVGRAS